jgi:hypothetical protein
VREVNTIVNFIATTNNQQPTTMFVLSPQDVLQKGLDYLSIKHHGRSLQLSNQDKFQKHYGSSPLDLANIWYDLLTIDPPIPDDAPAKVKKQLIIPENEKGEKGFKMFLAVHYFLWAYDKNSDLLASNLLASRFGICKRNSRGEPIWKWIIQIAALKAKKIVWLDELDDPNTELFTISIDDVDFKMNEIQHPKFNVDKKACSKKVNHCAVKYEITMAIHQAKCVRLAGPFKGGTHDLTMFQEDGLKEKLVEVRKKKLAKAIVDRGYRTNIDNEQGLFSIPDNMDSKGLKTFKTRSRLLCHGSFNWRIKVLEFYKTHSVIVLTSMALLWKLSWLLSSIRWTMAPRSSKFRH